MAFKLVSQYKDSVAGILSGIDLSNVANLYGAFERAARVVIQKCAIPEASGVQNLTIYSGVTDYNCSTDIFGTSIKDIRPQGNRRQATDFVYREYSDQFDREKGYNTSGTNATFEYDKGTPIIRIVSTLTPPKQILDTMGDTTDWTAGGNAPGLAQDSSFYYQSPASLRFNLANAGSNGYLEKTIYSVDLTDYLNVGVGFLAFECPTGSGITSVGLRIGSDSSNYYTVTNTEQFLGAFKSGEFQLVDLDLSASTTVGSPDITKITYIRPFINYNGTAQVNVRFGGLWLSLPLPVQVLYQTAAIFMASGTPSQTITTDADSIILNDAAYSIFEYEGALSILQQTGGNLGTPQVQMINNILNGSPAEGIIGLYNLYRGDNPSERLRNSGSWYD